MERKLSRNRETDFNRVYKDMKAFVNSKPTGDYVIVRKKFEYVYTCYIWKGDGSWDEFDKLIERYEAGETVSDVSTYSRSFDIVLTIHNNPAKQWWSVSAEAVLESDDKWSSKVRFIARDERQVDDILWGIINACDTHGRHHCP